MKWNYMKSVKLYYDGLADICQSIVVGTNGKIRPPESEKCREKGIAFSGLVGFAGFCGRRRRYVAPQSQWVKRSGDR